MEEKFYLNERDELINSDNKIIYEISKRMFDIVSSFIALIIMSPLFIIIAIAIRLESNGKAIFGHTRMGKNGISFKVYKFRSMYENSEEIFGNFTDEQKKEYYKNFKLDNDPRITKVGKFIRRTSLDELPQLINIIKGDMSVVGPRPIVEKEIEKYGVYFHKAFSVKSGLTGYWQANGRSNTSYDERIKMDCYYIDNRSFWLDIKIIFKTVISVFKKEGAI